MGNLIDKGHHEALQIYREEKQKNKDRDTMALKIRNQYSNKLEGNWNELFDFPPPDLKKIIPMSTSKAYEYDEERFIPRSIITLDTFPEQETHPYLKNVEDVLFVASYYLEKEQEMKEIEYESHTYFKYGEFLGLKYKILKNLGEIIRVVANLDLHTALIFYDSKFIPQDIVFPDLKGKLLDIVPSLYKK
jgi:hypothetical protein